MSGISAKFYGFIGLVQLVRKSDLARKISKFLEVIVVLFILYYILDAIQNAKNDIIPFIILVMLLVYYLVKAFDFISGRKKKRRDFFIENINNRFSDKNNAFKATAIALLDNAQRHSNKADQNQFFMFVVLVVTALFMIFAGFIADIDNRVISSVRDLNDREDSLMAMIRDTNREFNKNDETKIQPGASLNSNVKPESMPQGPAVREPAQSKSLSLSTKTEPGSTYSSSTLTSNDKAEAYKITIGTIQAQLESLREQQKQARDISLIHDKERVNSNTRMISAILLRISFSAVAIYLSTLLLRAYRYHTTTAAAYIAKYNAICLSDMDPKDFALRSIALSVENISFGKDPRHPFAEVLELVTGTLDKINKSPKDGKNDADKNTPTP